MSYSHEESIEEILTNYESAHDELADNDRNFWLMVTEVASANLSVTLDPRLTNRIEAGTNRKPHPTDIPAHPPMSEPVGPAQPRRDLWNVTVGSADRSNRPAI